MRANAKSFVFTIAMDYVAHVLGEFVSFSSQLEIQRPEVEIIDDGKVLETVNSDVPDLLMLHGTLSSNVPLSFYFRRGEPFKNDPGLTWNIHGEAGEIKVQGPGPSFQANDDNFKILVHDFTKDAVEEVNWKSSFVDLPVPARNVAALYETFAEADPKQYPDFENAVVRHRQIEELYACSEDGRKGVYI